MTARGLGNTNPLDRLDRPARMPSVIPMTIPAATPAAAPEQPPASPAKATRATSKRIRPGQTQLTCYIDETASEEARDAIMFLANQPEGPINLSDLVNQAIHNEIGRLRTSYNKGQPFPKRRRQLRAGRPV